MPFSRLAGRTQQQPRSWTGYFATFPKRREIHEDGLTVQAAHLAVNAPGHRLHRRGSRNRLAQRLGCDLVCVLGQGASAENTVELAAHQILSL